MPRSLKVGITLMVRKSFQSIWENGIFQNCFFLAQTLRLSPIVDSVYLVYSGDGDAQDRARFTANSSIPGMDDREAAERLDVLIEMSATLPDDWINAFRARGGKVIVCCVGNDFVIDAERLAFNLPHGRITPQTPRDGVWTLEEYRKVGRPWYSAIFRKPALIVPHLWAPDFIRHHVSDWAFGRHHRRRWRLAIAEPNVSMVKTSHVPMLVCEHAHRLNADLIESVCVFNGGVISENPVFKEFCAGLDVARHGLIAFDNRVPIFEMLPGRADALVCHQWENAQNYVYYEALYGGFPLIHNSHLLKGCGYRYHDFDCEEGGRVLVDALLSHESRVNEYSEKAKNYLADLYPDNKFNVQSYTSALMQIFVE